MPSLDVLLKMLEDEAAEAMPPKGWKGVYQIEFFVKRIRALIQASKMVYSDICHDVCLLEKAVDEGMESLERLASRLHPERNDWPHTVIVFESDDGYNAYLEDAIVCASELRGPILRCGLAPCYWIENEKELSSLAEKLSQKGYRMNILKEDREGVHETEEPSARASCTKSDGSCEGCGAQAQ